MAGIRYDRRGFSKKFSGGIYSEQLESRDVSQVLHYHTAEIGYPSALEMDTLTVSPHVWTVGDRFYKIAAKAYGDSKYWWIIPWFNRQPLEADVKPGDVIGIPGPLGEVLAIYGRGKRSIY